MQGDWKDQSKPWRTKPEIDAERQWVLTAKMIALNESEQQPSPFKGMSLSRAHRERLLAWVKIQR
jgi:hypothetical protein